MTTLWNSYASEKRARRAIELLLAAGVPARDVGLLTGVKQHDARREPVGEFGGAVEPQAPVGTSANVHRLRREGAGSFAGDPDDQRRGSFRDSDRDVIVSYERGRERSHVSGHRRVRALLRDAGLDDGAVDRIVGELHAGYVVVVAEITTLATSQV